jgi:hypothetical protein
MGKNLSENEFSGAPGGYGGTVSYGTGYGTPSGGNVTQNPDHFASDSMHKAGNEPSSSSHTSPFDKAEKTKSELPLDPQQDFNKQVNGIFTKKNTPSPDDLIAALQYELGQMVLKDKAVAKQNVLKNLKADPQHYSRLNMLNIDDEKMKVDEDTSTFGKTKKVLDEMIAKRKDKVVPSDVNLDGIFKDMWNRRNGYNKPTE